jgi:hypothetical protein
MHLELNFHSLPVRLLFGLVGFLLVVAIYFVWVRRGKNKPVE